MADGENDSRHVSTGIAGYADRVPQASLLVTSRLKQLKLEA